jgi:FkbM family methyltransferase
MLKDRFIQLIPYSIRKPLRAIYESTKKDSLRQLHSLFIHPGDLVFDIGANLGFYTESFTSLGAKVIAVEPQPCCLQMLKNKFGDNTGVTILGMGVAESTGELPLYIDSKNNTTGTFSSRFIFQGPFKNRTWNEEIMVPVTTLDDLIREYGVPSYCKIDVEGYEPNVLAGLSTPIPCISFEYYQGFQEDIKSCLDYLECLGEMRLNYAPNYDFTHLAMREWTDQKDELLGKICSSSLHYAGDIFVHFL